MPVNLNAILMSPYDSCQHKMEDGHTPLVQIGTAECWPSLSPIVDFISSMLFSSYRFYFDIIKFIRSRD
jgi:hypothetical protein